MNEGEFKKRIHGLWENVETPNVCQSPIQVHAQKRVLLCEIELIIDVAKKEFPTHDSCFHKWKESFPSDNMRRIVDLDTFVNEEREQWFLKWFGDFE